MGADIHDVADACGVSIATISRVFNRRPTVKEETRQRVLQVAREMGYEPKLTARRDCLAILVEGYEHISLGGYSTMLLASLTRQLFQAGYRLEILPASDVPLLREKFFRGAISLLHSDESLAALAQVEKLPVAVVNAELPNFPCVLSNDEQGMELAVGHLVEQGHSRIALLSKTNASWSTLSREKGFRKVMKQHGLSSDLSVPMPGDERRMEALAKLMKEKPTALIVSGEDQGSSVRYYLHLLNQRVPEDVSLITFENRGSSRFSIPPLTTLEQNFEELASNAVACIQQMEAGETVSMTPVKVDYTFNARETVSEPAAMPE